MRLPLDTARVHAILDALGGLARSEGRIYLTGGATALLRGWRASTVDLDLRLDPEPAGVFEAIARVKEELQANIELASPQDFLPELPGWRDRSPWVGRFGKIDVYHYDLYAQALAKIERSHDRDRADVAAMLASSEVDRSRLLELFAAIEPGLVRFPGIDAASFRARVEGVCGGRPR
jgi:hypothetical protein